MKKHTESEIRAKLNEFYKNKDWPEVFIRRTIRETFCAQFTSENMLSMNEHAKEKQWPKRFSFWEISGANVNYNASALEDILTSVDRSDVTIVNAQAKTSNIDVTSASLKTGEVVLSDAEKATALSKTFDAIFND